MNYKKDYLTSNELRRIHGKIIFIMSKIFRQLVTLFSQYNKMQVTKFNLDADLKILLSNVPEWDFQM